MSHRLRVRNYQAIKDAELDVDGFTVVVGPTNVGKSSLVRAFKGLVENQGGNAFIRTGEVTATVNVQGEGLAVEWRKGVEGGYAVTQDGGTEEYTSVGKGQPEFISSLGFGEIVLGKIRERPQIGPQFPMTPFLLQKPGSFIAEAISAVTGIDKVPPAIRAAEKDLRAMRADQKARKRELREAESELAGFEGLDDLQVAYDTVAVAGRQLTDLRTEVGGLHQFHTELVAVQSQVIALEGVDEIAVPDASELDDLRIALVTLEQMAEDVAASAAAVKALKGVDEVEVPEFPSGLVETVRAATGLAAELEEVEEAVRALKGIEEVEVPELDLTVLVAELVESRQLYNELIEARDAVRDLKDELVAAEKLYEQLALELREAMGDTCPLCGQELGDEDHIRHTG